MTTIFRIVHEGFLPQCNLRNDLLRKQFGEIIIEEWNPPEKPGELADQLCKDLIEQNVSSGKCVIEIDSTDRLLITVLALAAAMGAFAMFDAPVLLPYYTVGALGFPVFDVHAKSAKLDVPPDAKFAGYCRLYDAVPLATTWPETQ